ncbi:MAG: hydroxypyruvate isomerase [Moraxellaceae bacterium]|jgi:hydroxypyruvate isomerase|nr:hydroxypyruvate isomerase [Moraxellaceae bacterium]
MLKFSANLSMLFTERPLPERFAAARAAGFAAVEIQFPYELGPADLQRLLAENEQQLVLINVPAGDLMQGGNGNACVPGEEKNFRQAVAQAAEYAAALQVPTVNVLAGRRVPGLSVEACEAVLGDNLQYAVARLRDAGATTVLEAINVFDMPRFLVHSLEDMQRFVHAVPRLKMQFDCYHMSRMGEDVVPVLRDNLAQIGHVQFADSPGRHEPGSGRIDFRAVFATLRDSAYAGWCGAEYRPSRPTEETLAWLQRWSAGS